MAGRLQDKVALVVGAGLVGPGWGNGKAAAVLFAREGAKLLCADVNEDAANETAALIAGEGGAALAIRADVTSHDDSRRMVKACTDAYGRIDVLKEEMGSDENGLFRLVRSRRLGWRTPVKPPRTAPA